jgi:hypothetical protein
LGFFLNVLFTSGARDEDVRAGAHRIARREGFLLVGEVLRVHGVVLLAPRLAHHEEAVGEHLEHHRVRHRRHELDGVLVDLRGLAHGVAIDAEVGGLALQPLDGEHDVVGREVAAVVPLHAVAQVEEPGLRVLLLPFLGEPGKDLELLAAHHQRLVHLPVDRVREQLVLGHGIGREVVALARPSQGGGIGSGGKAEGDGNSGKQAMHGRSPRALDVADINSESTRS